MALDNSPWLTVLRVFLAVLFFISAFSKLRDYSRITATVIAFNLIPRNWAQPFSLVLICIEFCIASILLVGWQSQSSALSYGILLLIFTLAMGINLLRGRVDLDCGCFGSQVHQKIGFISIGRNLFLMALSSPIVLWGGGWLALDGYSIDLQKTIVLETILPILLIAEGTLLLVELVRQIFFLLALSQPEEK